MKLAKTLTVLLFGLIAYTNLHAGVGCFERSKNTLLSREVIQVANPKDKTHGVELCTGSASIKDSLTAVTQIHQLQDDTRNKELLYSLADTIRNFWEPSVNGQRQGGANQGAVNDTFGDDTSTYDMSLRGITPSNDVKDMAPLPRYSAGVPALSPDEVG